MVSNSLESAHAAIVELVEDFAAGEAHYLSPDYSEAQVRVSFINKFWMALGWDVQHDDQKNPYVQEVKVEDPQKILGSQLPLDVQAVRDAMVATGPGASTLVQTATKKLADTLGDIADDANKTTAATEADLASTTLPAVKQRVSATHCSTVPGNLVRSKV
jgi:hypothetical protein